MFGGSANISVCTMVFVWCYWSSATSWLLRYGFPFLQPAILTPDLIHTRSWGLFLHSPPSRGGWSPAHLSKLWGPSETPLLFFPALGAVYPMSSFILTQLILNWQTGLRNSWFKIGAISKFQLIEFIFYLFFFLVFFFCSFYQVSGKRYFAILLLSLQFSF